MELVCNIMSFFIFWIKPKRIKNSDVKKIMLIKLERIGDLVLSTPAIREIRKRFPESHISIIVNPYTKDIVDDLPDVDEVLVYDKNADFKDKFFFIKFLRRYKFDLAIDLSVLNFAFLPIWILYLSKSKIIIGSNNYGRAFLYNIKVKPYVDIVVYGKEVMCTLKPLGIESEDYQQKLFTSKKNDAFIEKLLAETVADENNIKVVIQPGGYYEAQRWSEENYVKISECLIDKYGVFVFFLGINKEHVFIERIVSSIKQSNRFVNLAGKLSLGQSMALISRVNLFIGSNSGPLHIACGFGVPTISFLGPTVLKRWSPQGKNNMVLRGKLSEANYYVEYSQNTDYQFLKKIKLEDVIEAIDNQFEKLNG